MKLGKQPTEKAKKLQEKLEQSPSKDIFSFHHQKNKIISFRKIIWFLLLSLIYQIELKTNTNNFNEMIISNAYEITEIDLTNFDTSTVNNMMDMFAECTSLTSINLSNLNTSNVETMHGMFWGCYSLRSLNLKSFDTSKVTKLFAMLFGCESLISIDLSNFDTTEVTDVGELFYECKNLQYINLKNFKDIKNPITKDMFKSIAKNVVICLTQLKLQKYIILHII